MPISIRHLLDSLPSSTSSGSPGASMVARVPVHNPPANFSSIQTSFQPSQPAFTASTQSYTDNAMQFQTTFGQHVPEHTTLISRPNTAQQPLYASVSPALHQNQSTLQNPSTLSNSQAFPPVPDYIMHQLRSGGFDQSSSSNPDGYGRFSSIPSTNLPAFPTNPSTPIAHPVYLAVAQRRWQRT
jgi:hypothetical protein